MTRPTGYEVRMSALLLLAAAIVPAGETFICTPEAVWDGDGPVWCKEGPRIRLVGIAARELDGSCPDGHPCPAVEAMVARDALVDLIGRPTDTGRHGHVLVAGSPMQCISTGSAGGGRTGAW